jgi:hypothetical protein
MSSPRKRPLHTNNHFTLSSESKPKEDKSKEIDATAPAQERPAHHRIHSELGHKREKKHERVPTTYPPSQVQMSMFNKKESKDKTIGECFKSLFCCSK